jgi:hypothetical protein
MRSHPNTIASANFYTPEATSPVIDCGFRGRKSLAASSGETLYVDGTAGWCVGIPASVFRQIGSPDVEKFPHYGGDSIYTLKATRAGFKACLLGDAKAILSEVGSARYDFQSCCDANLATKELVRSLFFNKKSIFRLSSQFFYHRARYGLFWGTQLFVIKLFSWLGLLIKIKFISYLKTVFVGFEKHV